MKKDFGEGAGCLAAIVMFVAIFIALAIFNTFMIYLAWNILGVSQIFFRPAGFHLSFLQCWGLAILVSMIGARFRPTNVSDKSGS